MEKKEKSREKISEDSFSSPHVMSILKHDCNLSTFSLLFHLIHFNSSQFHPCELRIFLIVNSSSVAIEKEEDEEDIQVE